MKRIQVTIGIALLAAAVFAAGCGQSKVAEKAAGRNGSVARVKQAPKAKTHTMVIPTGTNVHASLETPLSTDTNHAGDAFTARTIEAIIIDGMTVVPAGARVHGVLSNVQDSGRIKDRARMTLAYQGIVGSDGKTHAISAQPLTLQADSKTRGDVEKIAAGGVLGAIIGGIAGGSKDAAIGAGAGVAAGTILMLATKGEDVELNPGQRLNIHMMSPTSILLVAQK